MPQWRPSSSSVPEYPARSFSGRPWPSLLSSLRTRFLSSADPDLSISLLIPALSSCFLWQRGAGGWGFSPRRLNVDLGNLHPLPLPFHLPTNSWYLASPQWMSVASAQTVSGKMYASTSHLSHVMWVHGWTQTLAQM